jgi:hypothetical protein
MRKVLSLTISFTSFALVAVVVIFVSSLSLDVVLLSDIVIIYPLAYISVGNYWYSLPSNDINRHFPITITNDVNSPRWTAKQISSFRF